MNFQQLFATLSIPSFETVCSRGKISVIVKALLMSWSRGRSSIISSLQRLGLCFSMKKWTGLRPGFQNYLYFLRKRKENGECIFQMNLNYSNDRGPMYLRKLQYPLTSMKKTLIFIQIILKYAFTIFLFLRNTDNFESPASILSTFSY